MFHGFGEVLERANGFNGPESIEMSRLIKFE